jgi:hypothetical protein
MKLNAPMTTIYVIVAMITLQLSVCDGAVVKIPELNLKGRQRSLQNMGKETSSPTAAPVTPSPTRFPTVSPTDEPTAYPTAYPTQKKTMQRSPQAVVAPTSFPVSVSVPPPTTTTATNQPSFGVVNPSPAAIPATGAPLVVMTTPPSIPPTTVSPSTLLPTSTPTAYPTAKPSGLPTSAPSGSPVISTNTPTAFPTAGPTYSNLTTQIALRDFSVLLLSFDKSSAVNVGLVESTLEKYMNQTMMLEHLVDVSLTPIAASSAPGSNFTATDIRFAGTASFIIAVPTQETLSITQDGIVLSSISVSNIQKAFAANPSLYSIRVVNIGYNQFDPNSVVDAAPTTNTSVDGENKDSNSETGKKSKSGLAVGLVLMFSFFLVGGALYLIRRRRNANKKGSTNATATTKPASARKLGDSYYPSLRRQYPDIEKPKEESVNTPNDEEDDDESSAADLSSYMMTPSGSCATEIRGTTTVLKDTDKVEETIIQATEDRPTVEISVSHIEAVADDEDYTSTDDGSARFGATDMSECTFRG